jgi:hypothetical protein
MAEDSGSDEIVERYLDDLNRSLSSVSPSNRSEFVAEIRQHIAEGRAMLDPNDQMALRNLLDRVGSASALANELLRSEAPESRQDYPDKRDRTPAYETHRGPVARFMSWSRPARIVTAVCAVLVVVALIIGSVTLPRSNGTIVPPSVVTTSSTIKTVARVTIPDLVGLSLSTAENELQSVGLSFVMRFSITKPANSPRPNTVVAQEPAPGSQLSRGDSVRLTVYK